MYNARKAAQVIAYFAFRAGGPLHVVRAAKLVYLGDRESIRMWGAPILDEDRVSMKHGPVNSATYDRMKDRHDPRQPGWAEFVTNRQDHCVAARPGLTPDALDELSEADIRALDAVWQQFGGMDEWALAEWTHDPANVPEWSDPHGSAVPIPLRDMMAHAGVPDPDAHVALLEDHDRIDRVFARLR